MAPVLRGHEAVVATDEERPTLLALDQALQCTTGTQLRLVDDAGHEVVLPASVRAALEATVSLLVHERGVLIAGVRAQLTTQEVADLLGVSRPHVVKLLDEGALPFTQPGAHRRIALQDVLAYQEALRRERQAGLRRIVALGEEMEFNERDA
jgi:excisionase family DNA binding protein